MTPRPTLVAVGRKARCRVINRTNDRCENEVIDSDPAALQICPHHALKAAQLLEETGVLTLMFNLPPSMRSTT